MTLTITGEPRTKKNSPVIRIRTVTNKQGRQKRVPFPAPSEAYETYEEHALWQLRMMPALILFEPITEPVNVQCIYYMSSARRVDLVNLLEATCDILVKARVLADDNAAIVYSHDGSRVRVDRANPRAEIRITPIAARTEPTAPKKGRRKP